jgi:hypothetical protein
MAWGVGHRLIPFLHFILAYGAMGITDLGLYMYGSLNKHMHRDCLLGP